MLGARRSSLLKHSNDDPSMSKPIAQSWYHLFYIFGLALNKLEALICFAENGGTCLNKTCRCSPFSVERNSLNANLHIVYCVFFCWLANICCKQALCWTEQKHLMNFQWNIKILFYNVTQIILRREVNFLFQYIRVLTINYSDLIDWNV